MDDFNDIDIKILRDIFTGTPVYPEAYGVDIDYVEDTFDRFMEEVEGDDLDAIMDRIKDYEVH